MGSYWPLPAGGQVRAAAASVGRADSCAECSCTRRLTLLLLLLLAGCHGCCCGGGGPGAVWSAGGRSRPVPPCGRQLPDSIDAGRPGGRLSYVRLVAQSGGALPVTGAAHRRTTDRRAGHQTEAGLWASAEGNWRRAPLTPPGDAVIAPQDDALMTHVTGRQICPVMPSVLPHNDTV